MADLKISQLTGATTPLAGTEVLPIVQSSSTKKVSVANLTSGRSTGVLDLTINDSNAGANYTASRNGTTGFLKFYGNQTGFNGYTFSGVDGDLLEVNNSGNLTPKGNLVPANGQGIDFSATPGTGTSELLADYEEGTWTPTQGAGLVVVGAFSSSGTYTKVGRQVTVRGGLTGATSIASLAGNIITAGLPFTPASPSNGAASNAFAGSASVCLLSGNDIYSISAIANGGGVIYFAMTYFV
jgi:hypothetical protein